MRVCFDFGDTGVTAFGGRGFRLTGDATGGGLANGRNEDILRPVGILLGGLIEESLPVTIGRPSIPYRPALIEEEAYHPLHLAIDISMVWRSITWTLES